jgi:hypothetical protein
MVHFATGPTKWDPVCWGKMSLPHLKISQKPATAERFFASGNERSVFDYNIGGKDMSKGTGYYVTPDDKFAYLVDLMNMNMDRMQVYVTMTYDYIDGRMPEGWKQTKTVWLDAASCLTSEVKPPQQSGSFELISPAWTPNFEGRIIDAIGHLHDGMS